MPEHLAKARRAVEAGRVVHDRLVVQSAYDRMADEIRLRLGDSNPILLTVLIGGLIPAAELVRRFDFPFQMDALHASRYRGQTRGGQMTWSMRPTLDLRGRKVLIIDDILDEGQTIVAIRDELLVLQPAELLTAVLVQKDHERRDPAIQADFVGLHAPDKYLVGCGMDIHNYYRNLDHIIEVDA